MRKSREVINRCVEADKLNKTLASEYRHSCDMLKRRIIKMKNEIYVLKPKSTDRVYLEEQLKLLTQMFRTTYEIGREAEHYYEKGWWRSEVYTVNSR